MSRAIDADKIKYYSDEIGNEIAYKVDIDRLSTLTPPNEPLTCEGCIHEEKEHQNCNFSVKISIPIENTGVSSVFAASVWPFSLIFSLARRNVYNAVLIVFVQGVFAFLIKHTCPPFQFRG